MLNLYLSNDSSFLVLNGDILTNLNPIRLVDELDYNDDCIGSIAIVPLKSPYGIVYTNTNGRIEKFEEKPVLKDYFVNAGVYCFKPDIFDYLPDKGDIERASFPMFASKGRLKAVKYTEVFWKSVDTHKDLEEAEAMIKRT